MNRKNFVVGMGMGLMVGFGAAMITRPKKSCMKSTLGRALKTMGEITDSICDSMGW